MIFTVLLVVILVLTALPVISVAVSSILASWHGACFTRDTAIPA